MRTKDAKWFEITRYEHSGELCFDPHDVKIKLEEIEQEFIALQKENDDLKEKQKP
jgi:hypothetical protein